MRKVSLKDLSAIAELDRRRSPVSLARRVERPKEQTDEDENHSESNAHKRQSLQNEALLLRVDQPVRHGRVHGQRLVLG